jgi:hypothetical protein
MFYKAKTNDSLAGIAEKFAVPLNMLRAFNPHINGAPTLDKGLLVKVPNLEDLPANAPMERGIDVDSLIGRARLAINKGIRYKLGKGGMNATSKLPDDGKLCDCSGFVCWILGISRKTNFPFYKKFGGWIFTDSMVEDINSSSGIFDKLHTPVPGCIVVFGAGPKIGHVGLVSEVADGKMKKVIHCSSGNDKNFKDSIQETSPAVFNRADTVWGKFTGII